CNDCLMDSPVQSSTTSPFVPVAGDGQSSSVTRKANEGGGTLRYGDDIIDIQTAPFAPKPSTALGKVRVRVCTCANPMCGLPRGRAQRSVDPVLSVAASDSRAAPRPQAPPSLPLRCGRPPHS